MVFSSFQNYCYYYHYRYFQIRNCTNFKALPSKFAAKSREKTYHKRGSQPKPETTQETALRTQGSPK